MKRQIKSSILAILSLVCITTILMVSYAYFTSSDEVINTINIGDVAVEVVETFEPPTDWNGKTYDKVVQIKNNSKSQALIRVALVPRWVDEQGDAWPGDTSIVTLNLANVIEVSEIPKEPNSEEPTDQEVEDTDSEAPTDQEEEEPNSEAPTDQEEEEPNSEAPTDQEEEDSSSEEPTDQEEDPSSESTTPSTVENNIVEGLWVDGLDGYYYYNQVVPTGYMTVKILESVSANIPDNLKDRYKGKTLIIDVKAEAVQATTDAHRATWSNTIEDIKKMLDKLCTR